STVSGPLPLIQSNFGDNCTSQPIAHTRADDANAITVTWLSANQPIPNASAASRILSASFHSKPCSLFVMGVFFMGVSLTKIRQQVAFHPTEDTHTGTGGKTP